MNIMKSLEINFYTYGQTIINEGAKIIQWRKDSLFNKCWYKNCISRSKRMKLGPYLYHIQKNMSKQIKDLNLIAKTVKLLGKM